MQMREVQGRVEAIADYSRKPYYSININDEWFNGDDTLTKEISKGDTVKLVIEDSDDEFIDIEAVKKIQGDERNSSRSEQSRSKTGGGASQNPSTLSKNQQINLKVAHKSAVKQLDRRETENKEDYREMLTKLTKLHLESIEQVEEWMTE